MEYSVAALAHDSMKGRFTGTPEAKKAAAFIAAQFEKAGLKPLAVNNGFFSYYPLKYLVKGKTSLIEAINVLGAVEGNINADTIVILCAHYDHIGMERSIWNNSNDSINNGANDNASGIALLIELAKYYTALKNNRYTLVFIAFSGEELGLHGSAHTASQIDQSLVHAVINIDMVGRPISKRYKKCMVITENNDDIIKKLNRQLYPEKNFFIEDAYPLESLFTRSDHYSFSKVKNRIFFTATPPKDEYYHTSGDEYKTIDFNFLLSTTKKIAIASKILIE